MPIDLIRKIVFIHIPKTGGSSIERAFALDTPANLIYREPLRDLPYPVNKTPQHLTLRELRLNVGAEAIDACYRFAFVRNPWDRLLSEYFWRRKGLARRDGLPLKYYAPSDLESLEAFVRLLDSPEEDRIDARRGFDGHLEPQLSFVDDGSGNIGVNYIGRFESFRKSVREVGRAVGRGVWRVPHLKRSRRTGGYRRHYTEYSRRAVEEFYRDDIDRFGYEF